MSFKQKLPIIVAVAIPVLFVGAIALSVFLPNYQIHPTENFLYFGGSTYPYTYTVEGGHVEAHLGVGPDRNGVVPTRQPLFVYDVATDSVHQIDFVDAQKLVLDPGPTSKDGYIVKYDYSGENLIGFFVGGGSRSKYVIAKGGGQRELTGLPSDRYDGNANFIGWIVQ